MILMNSDDVVVNFLNDAFVCKAKITMVFQVYYNVLMHLNPYYVSRLDNFSRNLQIIGRRGKITRRMIVAQNHCRRISQDSGFENLSWMNWC